MVEYKKVDHGRDTGARGLGMAGTITGGLSLLGNLVSGNGLLGGIAPVARGAYGPVAVAAAEQAAFQGGFVTEKELCLTREISGKDSTIAQLTAEKYTDQVVAAATIPLANRICELEKDTAVNAARDRDFRHYVEREFVHQPKASIKESIVTCHQCGCECHCSHCC